MACPKFRCRQFGTHVGAGYGVSTRKERGDPAVAQTLESQHAICLCSAEAALHRLFGVCGM